MMSEIEVYDSLNHNLAVYAELKPQLASAQIFLTILQKSFRRTITLNIKKTSVEVKWSKRNHHTFLFEGVQFVPTACHSMQWMAKNQLHFRVQVVDKLAANGHLIYEPDPTKDLLKPYQGDKLLCSCSKCGQILLEQQRFKRVLPLPSDNWYEVADSLFCCKHKHTSTPEKHKKGASLDEEKLTSTPEKHKKGNSVDGNKSPECVNGENEKLSLSPKEGDCLVGETHFLVHGMSVIQQNVDVDKLSKNVICSRCRYAIGQTIKPGPSKETNGCVRPKCKVPALKVFTFSVNVQEQEASENIETTVNVPKNPSLSLEESLAELLVSNSKKYNSYRFVIESKQKLHVQPYILIWLLDSKCYQYTGETSDAGDNANECTVRSQEVVKLMYKDCLRKEHHSISEQWSKDLTVLSIDLPQHTCLELLDVLIGNTCKLPKCMKQQVIEDSMFYVGYLKKENSKPRCNHNDVAASRTE